jgi:hypothetical protein
MIAVTWRQFRTQAAALLGFLLLIAVALAVTGPHLRHAYTAAKLAGCEGDAECGRAQHLFAGAVSAYTPATTIYYGSIVAVYALPALIGMFWGSPLVARELETRTLRVAWSQSVTRRRWMAVKLATLGAAAVIAAAALSAVVTWWAAPLDAAAGLPGHDQGLTLPNRFSPLVFGARDWAPIGYALFAFALGVTSGVLLRRTLSAMAVTAAVLAGVQLFIPVALRPAYASPATTTVALRLRPSTPQTIHLDDGALTVTAPTEIPGAWVLRVEILDAAGNAGPVPAPTACTSPTGTIADCDTAINALGLSQRATYQPPQRYERFQLTELTLYLLLAVAVGALGAWRVRRVDLT